MSKIEVDTIDTQSSTTLQVGSTNTSLIKIGTSGDTVEYPAGTTFTQSGAQNVTAGGAITVKSGGNITIDSGATITNNGTATGFSADLTNLNATNLTSGTVPDARFPATLPIANGSALTNLNATNLGSGTVPDARFPATLPAISGANLTNLPASGITMADQWRLSAATTFSSGASNNISSNWERTDTTGYGTIGSAMSQSSGTFTFPTTGIYLIMYKINGKSTSGGNNRYVNGNLYTTTDNSSYAIAARGAGGPAGENWDFETTAIFIFDVSNTSTHKVQMGYEFEQSTRVYGGTNDSQTCVTFIRLGDT